MSAAEGREDTVDLAAETDFRLGTLWIRPSTCQVVSTAGEERVEPRVMEVLVTLHRAQGRTVTRDRLVKACWDGRIVSDDAVTRAIAKVRQLTRGAEPPPFTLETIPRVGFRLLTSGEPSTPTGSLDAPPAALPRERTAHRRLIIAGVAAAAAICSAVFIYWPSGNSGARAPSVAVHPFATRQSDTTLAGLADRTRDSIARRLAASGVPTVLDDGSSALNVTGAVDNQADKLLITGAISDTASGRILWSGTSERAIGEMVGIDEEFGRSLSRVLGCALTERGAAEGNASLDVFSLLLNACEAVDRQASNAVEITRRLIAAAPTLAGSYALRAFALAQHASQLDHLSEEAAVLTKELRAAASRAIALNPDATFAHVALGVRIGTEARYQERERNLRRALEIDPDHTAARLEYTLLLREVGRIGAARETLMRIDGGPGMLINGAFLHAMTGDFRTAYELIDRLGAVKPEWALSARWTVGAWWEDPRIGLAKLPELVEGAAQGGGQACFEAHLTSLIRAGAHPRVRGLPAPCATFINDWRIRMLARQGDIDGAYALMDEPMPRNRQMHMFLFYPELKTFRHDPRFMPLADRLGLLKYWRDTNQWPDFCAEPDLPYDCRQIRTAMPTAQEMR